MSTMAETGRFGRGLTGAEALFLVAGLVGLNIWVWSLVRTDVAQRHESHVFEQAMARKETVASPPKLRVAEDGLIGRLSIPRLGVEAMVREGDSAHTLEIALGHIPGTALPGERGNVGIAGHRDTLFRGLAGIRPHDTVVLETLNGTYRYQVEDTRIVKPEDVGVLRPGGGPELTLVTCYPFGFVGAAPERFIVRARMRG